MVFAASPDPCLGYRARVWFGVSIWVGPRTSVPFVQKHGPGLSSSWVLPPWVHRNLRCVPRAMHLPRDPLPCVWCDATGIRQNGWSQAGRGRGRGQAPGIGGKPGPRRMISHEEPCQKSSRFQPTIRAIRVWSQQATEGVRVSGRAGQAQVKAHWVDLGLGDLRSGPSLHEVLRNPNHCCCGQKTRGPASPLATGALFFHFSAWARSFRRVATHPSAEKSRVFRLAV